MILLAIDTVDFTSAIGIMRDGKITVKSFVSKRDDLLKELSSFLAFNKTSLKDVEGLVAYLGPGESFTGTRVGVSIINALSFARDIPSFGYSYIPEKNVEKRLSSLLKRSKDISKFAKQILTPVYSKEPHITRNKNDR